MNPTDTAKLLHTETIGTGPDLVMLHGLFGSGDNWRNQAKKLADRFTVHTMDARNHGDSPHDSIMNYPAMAADVIATCEQRALNRIHLLGHSMGGKTAMQVALQMPTLIEKLVVVDISPRQYPHHHNEILQGLSLLQQRPPASRKAADEQLAPHVDDQFVRAFLLKSLYRTEAGQYRLKINVDAINRCYTDIAAAIRPAPEHLQYDGSTLFIKGSDSNYLQAEDRPLVLSLFPRAQLKTIDGAGHWPHSEKPEVVSRIIADFLTA